VEADEQFYRHDCQVVRGIMAQAQRSYCRSKQHPDPVSEIPPRNTYETAGTHAERSEPEVGSGDAEMFLWVEEQKKRQNAAKQQERFFRA
jgi:hypothetical protein